MAFGASNAPNVAFGASDAPNATLGRIAGLLSTNLGRATPAAVIRYDPRAGPSTFGDMVVQGFVQDGYAPVKAAFAENLADGTDLGAALCVTVEGEPVVDLWGGFADAAGARPWDRDTIVNVYSTTKTVTALTALLLADRGELDFDAPVARYWPEFAANGKQDVKVSHVLSHSAGLPGWREPMRTEDLYDWEKATTLLAAQELDWAPGTACGYHGLTQGYLVGEVVRRITGRSLGTVLREEITGPLDADFHIGLPASEEPAGRRTGGAAGRAAARARRDRTAETRGRQPGARGGGGQLPRLAGRRNPRRRRDRQRACGGADPHHPRQRRGRRRAALHVRGRLPAGARTAGLGAGPGPGHARCGSAWGSRSATA